MSWALNCRSEESELREAGSAGALTSPRAVSI